jgi:hypothetical protein
MLPGLPEQPIRIAICHAPFDGHVVSIFAAGPQPDFVPQLWRRETIDGAFVPCALPPDLISRQADYDWFAAVAPNNPDILYLGAYDVHRGIRSPSGAWDWSNLSSKTGGDCIHADQHAIAFDPYDPGVLYIGCDGRRLSLGIAQPGPLHHGVRVCRPTPIPRRMAARRHSG